MANCSHHSNFLYFSTHSHFTSMSIFRQPAMNTKYGRNFLIAIIPNYISSLTIYNLSEGSRTEPGGKSHHVPFSTCNHNAIHPFLILSSKSPNANVDQKSKRYLAPTKTNSLAVTSQPHPTRRPSLRALRPYQPPKRRNPPLHLRRCRLCRRRRFNDLPRTVNDIFISYCPLLALHR